MSEQKTSEEHQIAVLIDYENVGLNAIQGLFDQITDAGRIIVKRAYADWSGSNYNRDQLMKLGIDPIHLLRSTAGGKNASDIKLVVDAIDLLFSSPVDIFVIVSSDSDFVPLINRLREAGKTVFGAGEQSKATQSLIISCDRYFYLNQEKSSSLVSPPVVINELAYQELILRAAKASVDEYGSVLGSRLHSTMLRMDPSFEYKSLGFSSFTKFLARNLASVTEIKMVRPKGVADVVIEIVDKPPAPAKPPAKKKK